MLFIVNSIWHGSSFKEKLLRREGDYACLCLIAVNRPPSCRKNAVSILLWRFAKWAGWEELPCPVLCSRLWRGCRHQAQLLSWLEMLRCSWQRYPDKTLFTQIGPASSLQNQNFPVRNKADGFNLFVSSSVPSLLN